MTVERTEILARLQSIFDDVFLEEITVTPELSAKDVEEWDSLSHISLVVSVEERFGIKFRVGEVEAAENVGAFVDLISEHLGKAHA